MDFSITTPSFDTVTRFTDTSCMANGTNIHLKPAEREAVKTRYLHGKMHLCEAKRHTLKRIAKDFNISHNTVWAITYPLPKPDIPAGEQVLLKTSYTYNLEQKVARLEEELVSLKREQASLKARVAEFIRGAQDRLRDLLPFTR